MKFSKIWQYYTQNVRNGARITELVSESFSEVQNSRKIRKTKNRGPFGVHGAPTAVHGAPTAAAGARAAVTAVGPPKTVKPLRFNGQRRAYRRERAHAAVYGAPTAVTAVRPPARRADRRLGGPTAGKARRSPP